MTASSQARHVAVLGAGGRAGSAITTEALARGLRVTAIVRNPTLHPNLIALGAQIVSGDALEPAGLIAATAGVDAVVSAVTPFTTPPESFDSLDTGFYGRVNAALVDAAEANGIARIVAVGLFATLRLSDGRMVANDEQLFPAELRPFAVAHSHGIEYFEEYGGQADWLVLAPPANLSVDTPATGHYRLGTNRVDPESGHHQLSYADLATAVLDQIERPTRHREHAAVYGMRVPTG